MKRLTIYLISLVCALGLASTVFSQPSQSRDDIKKGIERTKKSIQKNEKELENLRYRIKSVKQDLDLEEQIGGSLQTRIGARDLATEDKTMLKGLLHKEELICQELVRLKQKLQKQQEALKEKKLEWGGLPPDMYEDFGKLSYEDQIKKLRDWYTTEDAAAREAGASTSYVNMVRSHYEKGIKKIEKEKETLEGPEITEAEVSEEKDETGEAPGTLHEEFEYDDGTIGHVTISEGKRPAEKPFPSGQQDIQEKDETGEAPGTLHEEFEYDDGTIGHVTISEGKRPVEKPFPSVQQDISKHFGQKEQKRTQEVDRRRKDDYDRGYYGSKSTRTTHEKLMKGLAKMTDDMTPKPTVGKKPAPSKSKMAAKPKSPEKKSTFPWTFKGEGTLEKTTTMIYLEGNACGGPKRTKTIAKSFKAQSTIEITLDSDGCVTGTVTACCKSLVVGITHCSDYCNNGWIRIDIDEDEPVLRPIKGKHSNGKFTFDRYKVSGTYSSSNIVGTGKGSNEVYSSMHMDCDDTIITEYYFSFNLPRSN